MLTPVVNLRRTAGRNRGVGAGVPRVIKSESQHIIIITKYFSLAPPVYSIISEESVFRERAVIKFVFVTVTKWINNLQLIHSNTHISIKTRTTPPNYTKLPCY